MNRDRSVFLALAASLALAGCGGGSDAASGGAAAEPARTAAPTATATASMGAASDPLPKQGECDEVKYTPEEPSGETKHPESNFFEPDAERFPTAAELDELLLHDNVVVVTYAADTPKRTRTRLYDWTYAEVVNRTPVVVPDDAADALPLRARIATVELRCNGFDWKRLTAFANRTDIAPLTPDHG
jgi:hypothetical protein